MKEKNVTKLHECLVKMTWMSTLYQSNLSFFFFFFLHPGTWSFLFMSETWLCPGDVILCVKHLPHVLIHQDLPVTVVESLLFLKIMPVDHFSSFEVHLFECISIYISKIQEGLYPQVLWTVILSRVTLWQILVDICVCCPSLPLVKDVFCLVDYFNSSQLVSCPTHQRGHSI